MLEPTKDDVAALLEAHWLHAEKERMATYKKPFQQVEEEAHDELAEIIFPQLDYSRIMENQIYHRLFDNCLNQLFSDIEDQMQELDYLPKIKLYDMKILQIPEIYETNRH